MQIHIRRFVGRKTQARAAKTKHTRSLSIELVFGLSSLMINSLYKLLSKARVLVGASIILGSTFYRWLVHKPLPRPQI